MDLAEFEKKELPGIKEDYSDQRAVSDLIQAFESAMAELKNIKIHDKMVTKAYKDSIKILEQESGNIELKKQIDLLRVALRLERTISHECESEYQCLSCEALRETDWIDEEKK